MKTQISKNSFDKDKRYSGIYQQQGRMLTDADWNNLVDLLKSQLADSLEDIIGKGSPRNNALTILPDRRIQPGDLYIDGIRAELPGSLPINAGQQPDLPEGIDLPAAGPYVVYADVWERSLTALEDENIRDAGLNGADTCTRTQTMLQIKTCGAGINPEVNIPQKGDAALSLDLHDNLEASDPCDPCAGLTGSGRGRVGNYLFRLEIHTVTGNADNPTGLIIKWSSENGAEQYAAQPERFMPPGFVDSHYIYEFYNLTTEKHPGIHFTGGFTQRSGILKTSYEIPDGAVEPKDFVRRWDGYCELSRSGSAWTLVTGRDKGVDLSEGIPGTQPGYASIGPGLTVNLESFRMNLSLSGRTFLAGDYWMIPVRESVLSGGSSVCSGVPPEGIVHHYLRLTAVAADGTVELYLNDDDRRRHNFPPLTDLHAHDVDYDTACTKGLFLNFEGTVKQALDKICSITAGDVGFVKTCNTSIYRDKTIETVEDVLNLLCDIQAGQVSYKRGNCAFLDRPDINTVQDAIDALCKKESNGGCRVTVGKDGRYQTIEDAVSSLTRSGIYDICLCLLNGDHPLKGRIIKDKDFPRLNISINGCGPGSKILLSEPVEFAGINHLNIENLWIDSLDKDDLSVTITDCGKVFLKEVYYLGTVKESALLTVTGTAEFFMDNCRIEVWSGKELKIPKNIFSFNSGLAAVFNRTGRNNFIGSAEVLAENLEKLPAAERKKLKEDIYERLNEYVESISRNETETYRHFSELLSLKSCSKIMLRDALVFIRDQAHHSTAGTALVLSDSAAQVSILNSRIFGQTGLYGVPGKAVFNEEEIKQLQNIIMNHGQLSLLTNMTSFFMHGTMLTRLAVSERQTDIIGGIIEANRGTITGIYESARISDSVFARDNNFMLFGNTTLSGNNFETLQELAGNVIGETAVYTGNRIYRSNLLEGPISQGGGRMLTAVHELQKAANMPEQSW